MTRRGMMALFAMALMVQGALAQRPAQWHAAHIFQEIRKLGVLGSVLYVAAHPDDENTRFIAWCANEKLYRTAYVSLTRGDGGQNLIGPELGQGLGIIRTQELLSARRIDGGMQFFSRANDFGYSKTSRETMGFWDRSQVLEDMVLVIRHMRPDIIVCRFPPDARGGHGHHTASAELAIEAFRMAADPNAFPDQLLAEAPWQAKRIVTNTGRWWSPDIDASLPWVSAENIGQYNPLLGTSYNELAALSRSQHKSQGFGSTGARGDMMEYFEHLGGDTASSSLFEGVHDTWQRMPGSALAQSLCRRLEREYDFRAPHRSIPVLLELRNALSAMPDSYWKRVKLESCDELVRQCAGLYLEAVADRHQAASGDSVEVTFELLNRCDIPIRITRIHSPELGNGFAASTPLEFNVPDVQKWSFTVPSSMPISQPYWLAEEGTGGMCRHPSPADVLRPDNGPAVSFDVTAEVGGQALTFRIPLTHKWNDPVEGERYRPFIIVPPVTVEFGKPLLLFPDKATREVAVSVRAMTKRFSGTLRIELPQGWRADRDEFPVSLGKTGAKETFVLRITPSAEAAGGELRAAVMAHREAHFRSMRTISYPHIPTQAHFPVAAVRLAHFDLRRPDLRIGYLPGAGDEVAEGLRGIGFGVDELSADGLSASNLSRYGAVLLGIRFLNVSEEPATVMSELMRYAEQGGTVIVQYCTSRGLGLDGLVPHPLTLGRDRVTDEKAEVRLLLPEHPVLNTPNRITAADFEGWQQERGLYFASEWDAAYSPILRMNDPDEAPKDGSLLIARHGKGHFVYTGLSFFRQVPAGVPGAYRLLANLVSLGTR